ncbi:hypothetical protein ACQP00_37835 [Dactylosporangium sp. CS-047395]|uniref:hypothetical protein n=1 Tax=Dactylosporangium sp. CS-047395 TaxID=3239936 RepID=UPI003D91B593
MRPRRPLTTVIGGLLLVLSLLVCGVGGGVLLGPVSRTGQDIDLASEIGDKGYSIIDMSEGDDYWIYQPVEETWADSIDCDNADDEDMTWKVRRAARPATAPEKITHFDARGGGVSGDFDFTYYGTLHGDRTEAFLSIECTPTSFLVVPSRAPLYYLGAVAATGITIALAGLVVLVVGLIRRRRAPSPVAVAPTPFPVPPAPVPVPAGGPSRRLYWFVLPPVVVAVLICCVGAIAGGALGFYSTFDPPDIGTRNKGLVSRVMNTSTEYALYADETGHIPARGNCAIREQESPKLAYWRTSRPFGDAETVTYNGITYRYVGTVRVDDIFIAIVDCDDDSSLLLRPSRRSWPLVWGAVGVATLVLTAGAVTGLTVAIRRRAAAPTP